jgi:hypothetical protein
VNILKTFGLCLALATLVVVWALLPLRTVGALTGVTLIWVTRSLDNIPSMPVSIIYSAIESLELLPVVLNLDPEHLGTEASSQTLEEMI